MNQMNRVPFIVSAIAVGVLAAGCASEPTVTAAPAPVVVMVPQPSPAATVVLAPPAVALRAGYGRIESILAVPSAAAGATSNPNRRITMRMDDGSVQHFDTQAAGVSVGDRIEITANGTLRHPV
jgi:hypothetical protein